MRYSYLLALIFASAVFNVAYAQDDDDEGADGPPPPPPPPPPANQEGADENGPPPPPPPPRRPPPPPPQQGPGGFNRFGGKRNADNRRNARQFRAGEEILIRGGRSCYFRPACKNEQAKSRFKGKLSGPRVLCAKGKPTAQQREFVWKAHPCKSAEGKKHHFVRFENGKHPGKFLCLSRKEHKSPGRRYGAHFAVLKCKKDGGCAWKVKEALVYNRESKKLEKRFVFVNRKHKHFILRARRRCKLSPPGPRRSYAAQNYINEARVDTLGSVAIEPAPQQEAGYDLSR